MDGQDYLNQISASVRPEKKSKGLMSSKLFIAGIACVVVLIGTIILGAILGGIKGSEKDSLIELKLSVDNTSDVIKAYQSKIKSSILRSNNASLLSIFSNTARDVTNFLTEKYSFKEKDIAGNITEEAQLNKDGLEADLFEARINGNLDRVFAYKITYEISAIMNKEAQIYNSTKNDELKNILSSSYSSLENLYNDFNSFSETK